MSKSSSPSIVEYEEDDALLALRIQYGKSGHSWLRETVAAMDHSTLQQLCQAGGVASGGKPADLRRALESHICGQAWALEAETLCFWDAWRCTEIISGAGCRLKC